MHSLKVPLVPVVQAGTQGLGVDREESFMATPRCSLHLMRRRGQRNGIEPSIAESPLSLHPRRPHSAGSYFNGPGVNPCA